MRLTPERESDDEIAKLREKLAIAVDALEYYKDISAYWGPQHVHSGRKAKDALQKIKGGEKK